MKASVKYQVVYRHREKYNITEMCRFFKVSRSGYYDFVRRLGRKPKDEELAGLIGQCQESCKRTYGYRRVAIWLDRNGVHHNPKTVLHVMQKYGLL
ncbi:MAG: transposase, partial [Clostridia bacterium]|nr:transposase [Clostridia bacterium]